ALCLLPYPNQDHQKLPRTFLSLKNVSNPEIFNAISNNFMQISYDSMVMVKRPDSFFACG
ncbi:MAG: hypothetical protein ACRAVC_08815, partial [Trichormus sp.]